MSEEMKSHIREMLSKRLSVKLVDCDCDKFNIKIQESAKGFDLYITCDDNTCDVGTMSFYHDETIFKGLRFDYD